MSYENEIKATASRGESLPHKLDIGILRYLWQAGPFTLNRDESIPRFLTKVNVLKEFSDNELRVFTKYLHQRKFKKGEVIFNQGDVGYGFYFVLSGKIEIIYHSGLEGNVLDHRIATLDKFQYFGEMGLLEEFNRRDASAICGEDAVLLGLFKPDLEELLDQNPVVGAKFMREISLILAQRVSILMNEIASLRIVSSKSGTQA
jgi:CRP-like cAMP-binding protein